MKALDSYKLDELKLIYTLLHENITAHPALLDSELLHDLQLFLQRQASEQGIDVSLHAQWSNWLNDGVTLKGL